MEAVTCPSGHAVDGAYSFSPTRDIAVDVPPRPNRHAVEQGMSFPSICGARMGRPSKGTLAESNGDSLRSAFGQPHQPGDVFCLSSRPAVLSWREVGAPILQQVAVDLAAPLNERLNCASAR